MHPEDKKLPTKGKVERKKSEDRVDQTCYTTELHPQVKDHLNNQKGQTPY